MEEYTNMLRKLKIPIAQVIIMHILMQTSFLILGIANIKIGMGLIWQKCWNCQPEIEVKTANPKLRGMSFMPK